MHNTKQQTNNQKNHKEDEIATNVLSGGVSPYMALVLPRCAPRFKRLHTFEDAPAGELERWRAAFLWFMKKVRGCE